jgi:hypothetical protein
MRWREIVEAIMPKRKDAAPVSGRSGFPRPATPDHPFKELEGVRLAGDFDGPGGRIPSGTQGTILQVFDHGKAYQVEFEGPHDVPETVPAELLVSDVQPAQR